MVHSGYIGFRVYGGGGGGISSAIREKKIETTVVYWGSKGIMEKQM